MIAKYIFKKYVVIRHINRVNLPKYEKTVITAVKKVAGSHWLPYTQKKKLLNELKKIRVNFSTKFNYIFPPKSNLFEMTCCNLVV